MINCNLKLSRENEKEESPSILTRAFILITFLYIIEAEAIQYYIDELNRIFDEGAPASEIACMIVEPFQGEGGFIPAPGGTIGGTFCGNPVTCASALAVMEVMKRDDYAGKARHIGKVITKRYKEL